MYTPFCRFFENPTSGGSLAQTDFSLDGIYIEYTPAQGEKKKIKLDYRSILQVDQRPGNKLLIYFNPAPYQLLEVQSNPAITRLLKMTGHRPQYVSPFDFFKSDYGKVITIVGAIIAIVVSLYAYIIPTAANIFAENLPREYEINLGNKIYQQVIAHDTIDTLKTALVNKFARQIDFNSGYPIQITVVHNAEINAFATPGGHIIVFDGLLNKLENPDELAGLLSHEATHINERHSLKAISSDLSRSLFISIIFHNSNGISSVLVDNANMLNSLRFSREMERTADEGAIRIMLANNIDPEGMVRLLKLLKKQEKNSGEFTYLSTHPATQQRIADVQKLINNSDIRVVPNRQRLESWRELAKTIQADPDADKSNREN